MKKLKAALFILISVAISLNASGKLIGENFNTSTIKSLRLMGDVDVVCIVDTIAQSVIEYPDNEIDWPDHIFCTFQHGTLTIQTLESNRMDSVFNTEDVKPVVIKVTSDLREIENGYNSSLEVIGKLSTPNLKVKLSGNGTIKIDSITSHHASISILTGKGSINIYNIHSKDLSCKIIGTGIITVKNGVCKELKCKSVGTGKMYLSGIQSQVAKIKYSGGGYIKCQAVDNLIGCSV